MYNTYKQNASDISGTLSTIARYAFCVGLGIGAYNVSARFFAEAEKYDMQTRTQQGVADSTRHESDATKRSIAYPVPQRR